MSGTPHVRPARLDELEATLAPAIGLRVVEVRTDRNAAVGLDRALRAVAAAAVA